MGCCGDSWAWSVGMRGLFIPTCSAVWRRQQAYPASGEGKEILSNTELWAACGLGSTSARRSKAGLLLLGSSGC